MRGAGIVIAVATVLFPAVPAAAQPGRGAPEDAFQIRMGMFLPTGDSDFWDATEDVFTISTSDLDDFVLGFTFLRSVSNEVELGFNLDFYEGSQRSQYRDWVDSLGFPILHDTDLEVIPLTVDVRFIPGGRYRMRPGGRQIVKPLFYVGLGGGLAFWDYEEVGDFLDFSFDPPEIFPARFTDDGVAFEFHGLAGAEIPIGRATNLLFEARYSIAEDDLGGDFGDLAETNIDLGGTSFFGGVSFRF